MIENWIDDLCAVWAIQHAGFGTVKSYNHIKNSNFPESIDLVELARNPIALTFWPSMEPEYSTGGPHIAYWRGETEIHLLPDFQKSDARRVFPWYMLALQAAASHATLGGKVELFMIPNEQDAIDLTSLQYGQEAKHWGLVVKWIVKERIEGQLTISA